MKKLNSILLVDDDPTSCFLTRYIIEEMHVTDRIYTVRDGKEALELLREKNATPTSGIDLILLDINMPDMDGFEFLEVLESLPMPSSSSIVMLTTSNNHRDLDKAKMFRVTDYLNKPITEEKLSEILTKHFSVSGE
jgi:CheY-like chemotaxis protein